MSRLNPYTTEPVSFLLEGDVQILETKLQVEFVLRDSVGLFLRPPTQQTWKAPGVPREDGLWQHTCFEVFLNPVGTGFYYEFNFSLKPAWNLYRFDGYRVPQPAQASEDFELKSMIWNPFEGKLSVDLSSNTQFRKFNVGLSAVLEEKSGTKHFCALVHKGPQPDFHLLESFTLLRG